MQRLASHLGQLISKRELEKPDPSRPPEQRLVVGVVQVRRGPALRGATLTQECGISAGASTPAWLCMVQGCAW